MNYGNSFCKITENLGPQSKSGLENGIALTTVDDDDDDAASVECHIKAYKVPDGDDHVA